MRIVDTDYIMTCERSPGSGGQEQVRLWSLPFSSSSPGLESTWPFAHDLVPLRDSAPRANIGAVAPRARLARSQSTWSAPAENGRGKIERARSWLSVQVTKTAILNVCFLRIVAWLGCGAQG